MPPLYALRAFETAARLGSFSQAAAALHVTPGAVSRHVSTLESWFACRLFVRHGPKVTLTDAGYQLAKALNESFSSIDRACQTLRRQAGKLRLKAPSTLTMRWLLDVLQQFRQQHQRPEVEMSSLWMDRDSVDFTQECEELIYLIPAKYPGLSGNKSKQLGIFRSLRVGIEKNDATFYLIPYLWIT